MFFCTLSCRMYGGGGYQEPLLYCDQPEMFGLAKLGAMREVTQSHSTCLKLALLMRLALKSNLRSLDEKKVQMQREEEILFPCS